MELALHLLEREFRVFVQDPVAERVLLRNFSRIQGKPTEGSPIRYHVAREQGNFRLKTSAQSSRWAVEAGHFLNLFEEELISDLQKWRPDLLFIQAAVLSDAGRTVMLVGPPGAGKSTMALALAERGFRYLSDELAPIDVGKGLIYSYAHALSLKQVPPGRDGYPPYGFSTLRSWHLPAEHLNCHLSPAPLGSILFLERGNRGRPLIKEIPRMEATARLLSQSLNCRDHPSFGIDAAESVVRRSRCLILRLGEIEETVELLATLFGSSLQEKVIGRHSRQLFPSPSSCG